MSHDLFQPVDLLATPHGVAVAVSIPDRPDAVPASVLATLADAEARHAVTLGGYRQVQFVGGRIALREARRQLGAPLGPVLPDARGTPVLPAGFVGSVSHKRDLAIAMVALDDGRTLGVDLEDHGPARPTIAPRVLRPVELEAVDGLPPSRAWIQTVLRFSIKESIYKAIDPWVRRFVGFDEAEVHPDLAGRAEVKMHLAHGEGPFDIEARYAWWRGRLLTSVRIAGPGRTPRGTPVRVLDRPLEDGGSPGSGGDPSPQG
jgi:enterobactin synthetase component D